jgi:uncharacterized lipoprotein YajG
MSKKIIILILSSFLFTGCATVSEKANGAYDYVAGGISKGYNSVKNAGYRWRQRINLVNENSKTPQSGNGREVHNRHQPFSNGLSIRNNWF